MADVLVIVPTRGRPESARRLLRAWEATSVCSDLVFCLDMDDSLYRMYTKDALRGIPRAHHLGSGWLIMTTTPSRTSLADWTNRVAMGQLAFGASYAAFVSLGDDHVPQTPGWDRLLLDAAVEMGGGFTYGDDGLQGENLPTACLVTANVVRALGWMCLPGQAHMACDGAWKHLGLESGQIRYLKDVKIKHLHFTSGLSPQDATYDDAYRGRAADDERLISWLTSPDFTESVRQVQEACAIPGGFVASDAGLTDGQLAEFREALDVTTRAARAALGSFRQYLADDEEGPL